ncbi:MAG: thrombospondin type 3 repeat-containing protein [Christiangramia sp.]|nr:thrombospondin type 3 repeat-containing protein [Christiangramia sp.]
MKKIKIYLSFIAIFALLFTSCSKDEGSNATDSDKATLSFGAIVADLAAKSTEKQSAIEGMPVCSDDAPAYVEIVLMQGDNEVVGTAADPYRVDLVAGQVFTEEDEALELTPGNYSLNHFSVYDADGDLLWLAPRGGALAAFVDNSLPLAIELGAGVKKYVDVSVLCYDDRDVNLYGYQFFELDINEAFEFCFFANYCTPEGRHFPARYSVDISIDGNTIYEDVVNTTGRNDDGDLFAEALCFALPNLEDYEDNEEYIDYTLTLLDWTEDEDAYGDVEQMVITGSLSRAEIMANFDGDDNVEYEHFRFGCGDDQPVDSDGDGVIDENDNCPNEAGPASNNGCPENGDTDSDGDGVLDGDDDCPDTPSGATVDANGCPIDSDNDGVYDGIDACPNEAGPADNDGCPVEGDADGDGVLDGSDNCPDTPSGAIVDANGCPIDTDGDGIYDGIDACPNENPVVDEDNDGCEDPTTGEGCENLPAACALDTGVSLPADCYYASLDASNNGWVEVNSDAELQLIGGLNGDEPFGDVTVSLSGTVVTVILDGEFADDRITAYGIEVRPNESDVMSSTCWESICNTNVAQGSQLDPISNTFDDFEYSYPIYVKVDIVNCTAPIGTPD